MEKSPVERIRREDNIKVDWTYLAGARDQRRGFVNTVMLHKFIE
jgi:hypothetical protein